MGAKGELNILLCEHKVTVTSLVPNKFSCVSVPYKITKFSDERIMVSQDQVKPR